MNPSGMWEIPAKWYQICSTMTLTCHELKITNASHRVKLNVEVVVILDESNHNQL